MKKFMFITTKGFTYQPNSESIEPDIENLQVIGISSGESAEKAFENLIAENGFLLETPFNEIISYELANTYKNSKKYFYIS